MSGVDDVLLGRDTPAGVDDEPGRVEVTSHARLAWLRRVDPETPYPANAIRGAWANSEPVPGFPAARQARGLYLIFDEHAGDVTVLTVYPVGEFDLGGGL